jgi:hypothetical protein
VNINFFVIGRALGVDRPQLAVHVLKQAGQERLYAK